MSTWNFTVNTRFGLRRRRRSRDCRAVAEMFGLPEGGVQSYADRQTGVIGNELYRRFRFGISPGQIMAVVGPSGSGKSVLLRHVRRRVPDAIVLSSEAMARQTRPAIECLHGDKSDFPERLAVLSRCGLAEAAVLLTRACDLSGGQQYRLALAEAIWQAMNHSGSSLVLADEFASNLDIATAQAICRQMRRLVSNSHGKLALLLATPREELLAQLEPDAVIHKPLFEGPKVESGNRKPEAGKRNAELDDPTQWPIVPGTLDDYRALARFHYLAERPACFKRIWTIRVPSPSPSQPAIAAVMVISPPVRCCRGRNVATKGRYVHRRRRRSLARLNAEVETISRVIVHPMYRSCGLAVRLVRHALTHAATPYVEALAAMGSMHPLFSLAGMGSFGPFDGATRRYTYYLARVPSS
jgi:ABC-type ATPase with predicted acetyltransferase domain